MRLRNIAIFSAVMLTAAVAGSLVGPRPAEAVAREIVELQRDVTSLLQGQKDLSTQMTQDHTVMKTLVEQTGDQVGKLNGTISSMQKSVQDVQANSGARLDTMSTQVQGLSDNLEEIKSRLGKLNQQLVDLQNTVQSLDAKISGGAPPPTTTPTYRQLLRASGNRRARRRLRRPRRRRTVGRHALFEWPARHHQRQIRSRPPGIPGLSQVLQRHRSRFERAVLSRRNRLLATHLRSSRHGIRSRSHQLSQELQARSRPSQEGHGPTRTRPKERRRPRTA